MQETGRTPQETLSVMTELVLPSQSNLLGNLLGGQLMHLMDIAGALTCRRHCGFEVATVAVDKIEFRQPVRVGEVITITSKLIFCGRTSMKVRIEVVAENTATHESQLTNTAFFTYVALDAQCRPTSVPPLLVTTDEEKALYEKERRRYEKKHAAK